MTPDAVWSRFSVGTRVWTSPRSRFIMHASQHQGQATPYVVARTEGPWPEDWCRELVSVAARAQSVTHPSLAPWELTATDTQGWAGAMPVPAGGCVLPGIHPVAYAVGVVADVCEGLAAAHDAREPLRVGRIDRDQVWVSQDGRAVLLAPGVSAVAYQHDQALRGRSMAALRTPMSPEELKGLPWTPSSDVYHAGRLLFCLLASMEPVPGNDPGEHMMNLGKGITRAVTATRADVPDGLATLLAATLSSEPGARPRDARSLAEALTPYRETAKPSARPWWKIFG